VAIAYFSTFWYVAPRKIWQPCRKPIHPPSKKWQFRKTFDPLHAQLAADEFPKAASTFVSACLLSVAIKWVLQQFVYRHFVYC
jgi:hypothetical protein